MRSATRRIFPISTILLVFLALGGPTARAQQPSPEAAATPAATPVPPEPAPEVLDRRTPRGAMAGYLTTSREGNFEEAASYLDLSPVPAAKRAEEGPRLARELKSVLDQTVWVDLQSLSLEPPGQQDDSLPSRRDRVGTIEARSGPVPVFVDRVRRDGELVWVVSATTVARVPELYDEFGYGPIADLLPAVMVERSMLDVRLWQWLALPILVMIAYFASWLLVQLLFSVLGPIADRSDTDLDDRLIRVAASPLRLGAAVGIFASTLPTLGLALSAQHFFVAVEKILGVVTVTWLLTRIVDMGGGILERRLQEQGKDGASLVPLGRKTLKTVIVALAVLAAFDTIGFDVTAVIAGLGVGGLAVALGAQRTLENLFGGATLIADRPVQVGDFCRFGDKVGVVEEIGLRSTRIRTLARTLVTVPNAEFSQLQLENFAARDKIWFNPTLGLRYETTPEQMRYVLVKIRELFYAHPKVDPDPARIRFAGFGDFSLNLEVFAYVKVTDFGEYLEITEDLNLRIMDIVAESGTGFAFPSSTTYVARDEGVDSEKTRRAEEQVRSWREAGEIQIPAFAPERIDELAGSIEYPPAGASVR